jgi:molecular chaperone GrpE
MVEKSEKAKAQKTGKMKDNGRPANKQAAKKPDAKDARKTKKESEAEARLQELQDKYLRLSAEFDNYRKRTLKEKADLTKYASEEVLVGLLPVFDDIERAMHSMDKTEDIRSIKDGILLIYNKFSEFLKQKGIQEIESLHKDFDTDCHDAITKVPAPEKDLKGKVVDVIEKGYLLNGKVVRYSKVVVGD